METILPRIPFKNSYHKGFLCFHVLQIISLFAYITFPWILHIYIFLVCIYLSVDINKSKIISCYIWESYFKLRFNLFLLQFIMQHMSPAKEKTRSWSFANEAIVHQCKWLHIYKLFPQTLGQHSGRKDTTSSVFSDFHMYKWTHT